VSPKLLPISPLHRQTEALEEIVGRPYLSSRPSNPLNNVVRPNDEHHPLSFKIPIHIANGKTLSFYVSTQIKGFLFFFTLIYSVIICDAY
jgi:hypothetical protein